MIPLASLVVYGINDNMTLLWRLIIERSKKEVTQIEQDMRLHIHVEVHHQEPILHVALVWHACALMHDID
jgi:hypothetical protein